MLLIYNTILALIVLIPLIAASGEIPLIMEQPNATDGNTWFLIILAGVLGFAINIVVYLLLKLTSPLTHNITGQLKGAVQTILAFYLFQNPVTIMVRSASVAQRTPALPPRDTNTLGTVALDVECCRHRPHHRRLDDVLVCSLPRDEVTLVNHLSISISISIVITTTATTTTSTTIAASIVAIVVIFNKEMEDDDRGEQYTLM